MKISVTFLSSYLYCARKLYLEKVLGIRSPIPQDAIIKGSIRHHVYEGINKVFEELVKGIKEIDFDKIFASFREKYLEILRNTVIRNKEKLKEIKIPLMEFFSDVKPMIVSEAHYRADRIFKFIRETGYLGDDLWANLTPKVKPEYRVENDEIGLKGVIDELEVYEKYFVPVELKTGKSPMNGVWPGHKIQVAAYAMLIEAQFGVLIEKGVIRYLDSNQSRDVVMNPFLKEEVMELIKKVNELLKSPKLPEYADNENKCTNCDLKDFCYDEEGLKKKAEALKAMN